MHDCTIVSKTALSEQKQDPLNTSVSVVAPEMQYNRSKSISHTFFTLLPTKGDVAGDVAQRDARAIITFELCILSYQIALFEGYNGSYFPPRHVPKIRTAFSMVQVSYITCWRDV